MIESRNNRTSWGVSTWVSTTYESVREHRTQLQRPLTHHPIEGQPNVIGDQTYIVDNRLHTIQGLMTKITRIIL